jgi:hypothetical protein
MPYAMNIGWDRSHLIIHRSMGRDDPELNLTEFIGDEILIGAIDASTSV